MRPALRPQRAASRLASALLARGPSTAARLTVPAAEGRKTGDIRGSRWSMAGSSDDVDEKQQVDIERLINVFHELQDQVKAMEASLAASEQRTSDRLAAVRSAIGARAPAGAAGPSPPAAPEGQEHILSNAEEDAWDSYRNSFTFLMAKGYLQTVDQLRDRLMDYQWELGLRPIALQTGVSRFEAFAAAAAAPIDFATISELYEDPSALHLIADNHLRMQARGLIRQAEAEGRAAAFATCTAEAQRLASQFSEGEFISKLIPDPLEHGMVDALRKVLIPAQRLMGGGR